jgi:glycosyltransferase involved in cell wall biosynthesis
MKIAFLWFGMDGRYGQWHDGLYAAMRLISKEHEVAYFDLPLKNLTEFNPDVVLFWEAPCTAYGKDAAIWQEVCELPYKKCLLFAGGPLKAIDVKDFDLVFVESRINEEDCERQGIPYKRAFGVNTSIFKPKTGMPKTWDAFMQATFAEWKRHELFASVGRRGAVAGRLQQYDRNGYEACKKAGVSIFPELPASDITNMINMSHCVLNTSSEWGGGQRCTLEAMACGVPVIVMSDSPKNREFVEASGGGIVSNPDAGTIRGFVNECMEENNMGKLGLQYIQNNWTEYHYAKALMEGINSL